MIMFSRGLPNKPGFTEIPYGLVSVSNLPTGSNKPDLETSPLEAPIPIIPSPIAVLPTSRKGANS